jgi:hypothetical protein
LSAAIGTSVEFVSISISKGREVLIPLESATRRALGEELPKFIASVQKSLQEFFSSAEIQSFVYSIMEIPQNVIQSIQGALISYTGSTFAGVTEIADKVDWWV